MQKLVLAFLMGFGGACWGVPQDSQQFNLSFAHFAAGAGYSTTFTFINTGTTTASGTLQFFDSAGNPMTPLEVTVAPRGTNAYRFGRSGPAVAVGWAQYVGSGGRVTGVATIQYTDRGILKAAAGVLPAEPAVSASIPVEHDVAAEVYSGYAVANPGTTSVRVKVAAYTDQGTLVDDRLTITIPPGAQIARFVHEDLPDLPFLVGSVVLTSLDGQPVIAVALTQTKGLLSVVPVVREQPGS